MDELEQLKLDLLSAREENEQLMRMDYWPERVAELDKEIEKLKRKVHIAEYWLKAMRPCFESHRAIEAMDKV